MKQLEGEKYATISLIPFLVDYLRKWIKNQVELHSIRLNERARTRDFLEYLIRNIHKDFEARWGREGESQFNVEVQRGEKNRQKGIHPVVAIATALDPRYKGLRTFTNEDKENIWEEVHSIATNLSEDGEYYDDEDMAMNERNQVVRNRRDNMNNDGNEELLMFMMEMNQGENEFGINDEAADDNSIPDEENNNIHYRNTLRELETYKEMPILPIMSNGKYNDPFTDFWKVHQKKLPVLAAMAKKYLVIPATSAPSERIFSKASLIISKRRNRLNPENAGTQIFLSGAIDWYQNQKGLDDINN